MVTAGVIFPKVKTSLVPPGTDPLQAPGWSIFLEFTTKPTKPKISSFPTNSFGSLLLSASWLRRGLGLHFRRALNGRVSCQKTRTSFLNAGQVYTSFVYIELFYHIYLMNSHNMSFTYDPVRTSSMFKADRSELPRMAQRRGGDICYAFGDEAKGGISG